MQFPKSQPVDTIQNLKERVERFFRTSPRRSNIESQLSFELTNENSHEREISYPSKNIAEFLDFMSDALPDGDMYVFGGILRDLALLGRRGFNSDIDLVVEGNWGNCIPYIESLGARKNKFGGYRLEVAGWPIDIWNARETWAIKQGIVPYKGISSLTETTVLNWDAILMNWRTRNFIMRINYLDEIKERILDVVLKQNPNPLGMAVRVFRHLCLKDARKITYNAAEYLGNCTHNFSLTELRDSELGSYGNSVIDPPLFRLFERFYATEGFDINARFEVASDLMTMELALQDDTGRLLFMKR